MLTGQTALVTGAGRGIGRAIAAELARQRCNVVLIARTAAQVKEAAAAINTEGPGRASAFPADVRDRTAIAAAVDASEEQFGPITLLVNNAGTGGPAGLEWEVDPDAWWECIESIVRGARNQGVTIFALHPGMVRTQLLDSYASHPAMAAFLDSAPPEAFSPPELAAGIVARIASGELDQLSGRFLDATSDLAALNEKAAELGDDSLTLRLERGDGGRET